MAQRDPDPSSLPEAVPVLSYERQTDDGAMEWVVRFIGAWVICSEAFETLSRVARQAASGLDAGLIVRDQYQLARLASLFCRFGLIVFGIAIARRYRYGFHGSLIVVAAGLLPELAFHILSGSGRIVLFALPSLVIPAAALFAVLVSVLRRADAKGVLQPVRANRSDTLVDGDGFCFLMSRLGWLYLAQGGMAILHVAMVPLFPWAGIPMPDWSWRTGIEVAVCLTVATCGVLLCQRRAWALWLLAWILPIQLIIGFLAVWRYSSIAGIPLSTILTAYVPTVLTIASNVFMLCLLARKAARTQA